MKKHGENVNLTVGMPGDGSVAWTRQTDPPVVLCKPRLEGSPAAFTDFLVAEALVQVGLDAPEQFLDLFGEEYPAFADWEGDLFRAWLDAGERLEGRLENLSMAIARGETSFTDGAELARSAIKHAGEIPPPFDALDAAVYLDHGPAFAVE